MGRLALSTTCSGTASLEDGTADVTLLVTTKDPAEGTVNVKITSIDADAAFVAARAKEAMAKGGSTVSSITCDQGATVPEGGDPAAVSCEATGAGADGVETTATFDVTLAADGAVTADVAQ